jgi:hypothetical protein
VTRRPRVEVVHHVARRHRPEVEVWPARAELPFADERSVNPAETRIRFEATVLNARSTEVRWSVQDPAGSPGAGSIDRTGLYTAPAYQSSLVGHTDVVVATLVEDPLRSAYAWVTLAGEGPWPAPKPTIQLRPKTAYLYYPSGHDNAYIDVSNTMQMFRATLHDSPVQQIEWRVNGSVQAGETGEFFLYRVTGTGGTQQVTIEARIQGNPAAADQARVVQINYDWPGLH